MKCKYYLCCYYVFYEKIKSFAITWPVTGWRNRVPLKALYVTKFILNDQEGHSSSFITNLVLFRAFRGPLFHKPVTGRYIFGHTVQQSGSNFIFLISSIFDKCRISRLNHTSYRKLYFTQFVQNSFSFNMDIICFDLHPHEDISNSRTRPKVLISSVIIYLHI